MTPGTAGSSLLDQATSQQLVRRLAGGDAPAGLAAPGKRRRPPGGQTRGKRTRRLLLGTLTPVSLLALSVASTIGVVFATTHLVAEHDGVTPADAVRIVIMGFALVMIFGQATSILRSNPLGRRMLAFVGRPVARGKPPAPEPGPPPVAVLLDQRSSEELVAMARPDLGNESAIVVAAHQSWRSADTVLWLVLSGAAVVLAGAVTASLAWSLVTSVASGNLALTTALAALFTALSAFGLFLMTRSAIRTLMNRRRRRRRPALLRLLRYLLRLIHGDPPGRVLGSTRLGGAPALASLVVLGIAVATVAGAGYGPDLLRVSFVGSGAAASATMPPGPGAAPGGGPGSPTTPAPSPGGGGSPSGSPSGNAGGSSSPAGSALALAPGSSPPSTAPGSTPPAPSAGPSPGETPTAPSGTTAPPPAGSPAAGVTPGPTSTGGVTPTPTPVPTPTPTPVPTPTPTPVPTPTPTPTPTPVATIDPTLDSDGDGVPDVIETQYGSNPNSAASTPENRQYDVAFNAGTCSDGVDNDGNALIDANGGFIVNTQVGPDPKCLP